MKEEKIREKHEILKLKVEVNRAESSIKQKNKELEDFKTHALSSLPVVAKAIFGKNKVIASKATLSGFFVARKQKIC
jgi:hypothetical protein